MTKPFNVREIKDLPAEPDPLDKLEQVLAPELERLAQGTVRSPTEPQPTALTTTNEVNHGAFTILRRETTGRTMITFVEDNGYPILRITTDGQPSQDLVMNQDQIKLLLRQMTLWITR